jgi:hypothetical protein
MGIISEPPVPIASGEMPSPGVVSEKRPIYWHGPPTVEPVAGTSPAPVVDKPIGVAPRPALVPVPVTGQAFEAISGDKSIWSILQDNFFLSEREILTSHRVDGNEIARMLITDAKEQGFSEKVIKQMERAAKAMADGTITGKERFWRVLPDGLQVNLVELGKKIGK